MRSILALKQATLVCLLALFITGCQRELGDGGETDPPPPDNCQLAKVLYYDSSGTAFDTAGFTYTNSKITHVTTTSFSMELVYTNDRVSRINYFNEANVLYNFYDSIAYNSSGTIESITFLSELIAGTYDPIGGYQLSYNADGSPAKVIERKLDQNTGTVEDRYEYVYTWANENISSMTVRNLATAANEPPVGFAYDDKPNHYHAFPPEFIFADNVLLGISGLRFGYFSPFLFSKNNIVAINGAPVVYSKDDQGNFNSITMGTFRPASYEYKCE